MKTDFREQIAAATVQNMERLGSGTLLDLGESGCVPMVGGQRWLTLLDLCQVAIASACLLSLAVFFVLSNFGFISHGTCFLVALVGLAVMLPIRKVKAWLMKACLAARADNFIKTAGVRTFRPIGIEDAKTLRKKKLVIEDRAICLFDNEQHRLLIEGCAYRYVIHARDVFSVETISNLGSSGALLKIRLAGQVLEIALEVDGMGPVASLIHSFNPEAGAKKLSRLVIKTLFGAEETVYRQRELPPPLAPA